MPKADSETEALQKELTSLVDKCREEQKKCRDSADLGTGGSIPKVGSLQDVCCSFVYLYNKFVGIQGREVRLPSI